MNKHMRYAPIRRQVMIALFLAGVLPVMLMMVVTQLFSRNAMMDYEYDKMAAMADQLAGQIEQEITGSIGAFAELANDRAAAWREGFDRKRWMDSLPEGVEVAAVFDREGRLMAETDSAGLSVSPTMRSFQQALAGNIAMLHPVMRPGHSNLMVGAYVPVTDRDGQVAWVLQVWRPMSQVERLIRQTRLGTGGYFVLLDGYGNILCHPEPASTLSRFDARISPRFWVYRTQGTYLTRRAESYAFVSKVLGALRQTGRERPWVLVGLKPSAEVLRFPNQEMRLQLGVTGLALGIALLAGLIVSRKLACPIKEVAEAAQRVAHGEWDAGIPEAGPREIRSLAEAFNQMVRELGQHRSRLENLVQQRTLKLDESQHELEKLAAHFRAAYESIVDGILIVEWPAGRVIAANQNFANLFDLNADSLLDAQHGEIVAGIRDQFVEPREDALRWEHYLKHSDETMLEEWEMSRPARMTLAVYSGPVKGEHGQVFARIWMFRDLTKQRLLEAELLQAQKMEAIGRLAGGVAHDFNNLLTGILGNLTMAEMELKPGGEPGGFIAMARQAAKRAAELVSQLLSFSRRSRLNLTRSNLNAIAKEVQNLLRHSVDPRVVFEAHLDENLWSVSADGTQLQQVVMNLSVNAVDAMPNGGRLTLHTRNVRVTEAECRQWSDARPGEFVLLSVADEGHGMSQEVKTHLFEPFFTTKGPGKGTGLGLATSYGIVKQHGGWIVVDSEIGKGTRFHIYLPRSQSSESASVVVEKQTPVAGGKELVLVVDDEPAVRGVVLIVLQKFGYEVLTASDGEEAVNLFPSRQHDIGLVLLDLTMPKLSGRDTFRKLRAMRPDLPIMISSGYPVDLEAFAKEVGSCPNGFVQKPFEVAELARSVRTVLDNLKQTPSSEPEAAGAPA